MKVEVLLTHFHMGANHHQYVKKPQGLSRLLAHSADLSPVFVFFFLLSEGVSMGWTDVYWTGVWGVTLRDRIRVLEGGRLKARLINSAVEKKKKKKKADDAVREH